MLFFESESSDSKVKAGEQLEELFKKLQFEKGEETPISVVLDQVNKGFAQIDQNIEENPSTEPTGVVTFTLFPGDKRQIDRIPFSDQKARAKALEIHMGLTARS